MRTLSTSHALANTISTSENIQGCSICHKINLEIYDSSDQAGETGFQHFHHAVPIAPNIRKSSIKKAAKPY